MKRLIITVFVIAGTWPGPRRAAHAVGQGRPGRAAEQPRRCSITATAAVRPKPTARELDATAAPSRCGGPPMKFLFSPWRGPNPAARSGRSRRADTSRLRLGFGQPVHCPELYQSGARLPGSVAGRVASYQVASHRPGAPGPRSASRGSRMPGVMAGAVLPPASTSSRPTGPAQVRSRDARGVRRPALSRPPASRGCVATPPRTSSNRGRAQCPWTDRAARHRRSRSSASRSTSWPGPATRLIPFTRLA